jgi:hypothetical protein
MENPAQTPSTRTFMCAVVFIDIIEYSKKAVDRQLVIKSRFNEIVAKGLEGVAQADRIILDTGDGAALCFLGDPEDALFVTNNIRNEFAAEAKVPELKVRIGINLGPVKVMRDLNGNPNIVGDGINVAQRIMSFAGTNQILVSRSYYEVVSRLTQAYSQLFRFVGAREDKHVREHELYEVAVGGEAADKGKGGAGPSDVVVADDQALNPEPQPPKPVSQPPKPAPPSTPAPAAPKRSNTALIIGATLAICLTIVLAAVYVGGKDDDAATGPSISGASQTGVFVNGRQLTPQEVQQHQAIYNQPVQPGQYWYDPISGLYGNWGREPIGYIRTGHAYGQAPGNASNGDTGIFLNGRQINATERTQWQGLFKQVIQPGRYWLDGNTGNVGVEGNPVPTGNVRAAIQASRMTR